MRHPLLWPLAAFAAGIIAAQHARFSFRELATSITLLLALAVIGLATTAWRSGILACWLGFLLAGAFWASLPKPEEPNLITRVVEREGFDLRDPMPLRGWVRAPPTVRLDRDQFVLEVESIAEEIVASGGVRVTAVRRQGQTPLDLHYGDRIELTARLRRLRNFENPGGFDRVGFLRRAGIHMTASLRPGPKIERIEGRSGNAILAAVWSAREWADRRSDALLGPSSVTNGVVKAMVLGDGAHLDHALGVSFQRTGTYHALVVSGSHVALLAWFFLVLFRRVGISDAWRALVTMLLLVFFVLLVGSQLPAVRAAAMVGAFLVGRLFYRQRRAFNVLAGVALAMLLYDPDDLFDASFQLSLLSVALIVAIAAPILERTLEPYRLALVDLPNRDRDLHLPPNVAQTRIEWRMAAERLPFSPLTSMRVVSAAIQPLVALGELVVVSASVQLGLTLPMAIYFHRVSWTGLSANLLVVPLMSCIVPVGFLAILTGWAVLGKGVALLVAALVAIVEWHARLTWLESRIPGPPVWLAASCALCLIGLAWALKRGRLAQAGAVMLLLSSVAAVVLHPFPPQVESGVLELTAMDVGQGEALFLGLPSGQAMLVDGGGLAALPFASSAPATLDIGEEVVSPYLWSRSIRQLDALVVSHWHFDHIGGVPALLENFQVRELWIGPGPSSTDKTRVLEIARRRGTEVVLLRRGEVRELGGVAFDILAPGEDYLPGKTPSNDDSLVLLAQFGSRTILLTGDIERPSEQRLLRDELVPPVDILKIAHHGSRTSTSEPFLDTARPWLALMSAGFDNTYGHPHPLVLDRLARRHMGLLRTDQDGLVSVRTDGKRVWVWSHRLEKAGAGFRSPGYNSASSYARPGTDAGPARLGHRR